MLKCTITNYSILQEIEEMYSESPELVSHQFSVIADSIRDAYGYSVPSSFKDGLERFDSGFETIQSLLLTWVLW